MGQERVQVTNFSADAPGRVGIAPVSVDGALFTDIRVTNPGNVAWDFEADRGNEGHATSWSTASPVPAGW